MTNNLCNKQFIKTSSSVFILMLIKCSEMDFFNNKTINYTNFKGTKTCIFLYSVGLGYKSKSWLGTKLGTLCRVLENIC